MSTVKSKIKKGSTSWKPASITDVINKEPGYRYRWSNKDPDNLAKKSAEGWETVSKLQSDSVIPEDSNRIDEGKNLTSTFEKRDVILQRIREEDAQARDEYYNAENDRRITGLTAHIKKGANEQGTSAHGEITISSRKGTQTYE